GGGFGGSGVGVLVSAAATAFSLGLFWLCGFFWGRLGTRGGIGVVGGGVFFMFLNLRVFFLPYGSCYI
ncbi:hypothetical protein, partial [Salmonella enterica]|uniref:hypothetical protein n=1 Tax=Salmonella enterica TaxID=28901 RepID=UPI0020C3798D